MSHMFIACYSEILFLLQVILYPYSFGIWIVCEVYLVIHVHCWFQLQVLFYIEKRPMKCSIFVVVQNINLKSYHVSILAHVELLFDKFDQFLLMFYEKDIYSLCLRGKRCWKGNKFQLFILHIIYSHMNFEKKDQLDDHGQWSIWWQNEFQI